MHHCLWHFLLISNPSMSKCLLYGEMTADELCIASRAQMLPGVTLSIIELSQGDKDLPQHDLSLNLGSESHKWYRKHLGYCQIILIVYGRHRVYLL